MQKTKEHCTTYQMGRVDIQRGPYTLQAFIGDQLVLSMHAGRDWTVAAGADLGDIVVCGCALIDFLCEQEAST